MPIVSIIDVSVATRLGLWRMTEEPASQGELFDEARKYFKSVKRQREYICVRLLLKAMLPTDTPYIIYEESGRPQLSNGYNISISHTQGLCAVIVSKGNDVAVDVEKISNRVEGVAGRFLLKDEVAADTITKLVYWCAKETMYKLFSTDRLTFSDIRVRTLQQNKLLSARNMQRSKDVEIHCIAVDEYVVTYAGIPQV